MNARPYCQNCGHTGPETDFVRDTRRPSGYRNRCLACERTRTRAWRLNNRDRDIERKRKNRPKWARTPKTPARSAVRTALRRGDIVKPERCDECAMSAAARDLQAHHHDYSKPLEVTWLCRWCHAAKHRKPATAPDLMRRAS